MQKYISINNSILTSVCLIIVLVGCRSSASPVAIFENIQRSGTYEVRFQVQGRNRIVHIYLPQTEEFVSNRPLVIMLHGGAGGKIAGIENMAGWKKKAQSAGFIVAYPLGSGHFERRLLTWNAGNCCGYAREHDIDDVAFIKAFIDYAIARLPVDASRVYATGMSNGAMMSHRLACELTGRLAAIAPVVGSHNYKNCKPSHPIAVMAIRGMLDSHVAYAGGRTKGADGKLRIDRSAADGLQFWARANACTGNPERVQTGRIIREGYAHCQASSAVWLYSILDGRHAWPGGGRGWIFGDQPTDQLNATDVIWEFFKQHRRTKAG